MFWDNEHNFIVKEKLSQLRDALWGQESRDMRAPAADEVSIKVCRRLWQ